MQVLLEALRSYCCRGESEDRGWRDHVVAQLDKEEEARGAVLSKISPHGDYSAVQRVLRFGALTEDDPQVALKA